MSESALSPAFVAAIGLFDAGRYLAAHELLEELWEGTEGPDAGFYKGLLQAAIALHHFREGNLDGAARLLAGHRRCLAPYLPRHHGVDVEAFLADMQRFLRPALAAPPGEPVAFAEDERPRIPRTERG